MTSGSFVQEIPNRILLSHAIFGPDPIENGEHAMDRT